MLALASPTGDSVGCGEVVSAEPPHALVMSSAKEMTLHAPIRIHRSVERVSIMLMMRITVELSGGTAEELPEAACSRRSISCLYEGWVPSARIQG